MKIFELYFNPKGRGDRMFESFVFEPESQEQKNLGFLCMAGELTKTLPQNNNFFINLSEIIKNKFYTKADSDFSESLKEANVFLDKETKTGNVGWLGNLNFAILNISNSILNFTKVGNIKILLLREREILDISQNLELQDQEPYPMKVFSNVASGKLLNQDKIIVLTDEVFSAISQNQEIFSQLQQVSNEKELKNIFKIRQDLFSKLSGICLFIAEGSTPSGTKLPNISLISRKMPKGVILIFILLLILGTAHFLFKGEQKERLNQTQEIKNKIEEARYKITMAENFIIMRKDEKAQALFREAWGILQNIDTKEAASFRESIRQYIISTPR